MKTATLSLLVLLLSLSLTLGFSPVYAPRTTRKTSKKNAIPRDEIANELEELGEEIKPHLKATSKPDGFDEFNETTLHKLQRELRERDKQYHDSIKELKNQVAGLALLLETEEVMVRAAETELKGEISDYEQENESVRRLLAQAVKLVGRRIGKGVKGVLRFFFLIKME